MIPNRGQKDDACKMTKQQNMFFFLYISIITIILKLWRFDVTMSSNINQTMMNKFLYFLTKIKIPCPSIIKCLWLSHHSNKAKREQNIRHCILVRKKTTFH